MRRAVTGAGGGKDQENDKDKDKKEGGDKTPGDLSVGQEKEGYDERDTRKKFVISRKRLWRVTLLL